MKPHDQVIGFCVICRKPLIGNRHMTRSKYCGTHFDEVENERVRMMSMIRKASVRRVQRRFNRKNVGGVV